MQLRQSKIQSRVYELMVKTDKFTAKCKGDRVAALKRQISLW